VSTDGQLAELLLEELERQTGEVLGFAQEPERLHGGYSSDIAAFTLVDPPDFLRGPLVLRFLATESAVREQRIQTAVAAAGYPTPMPLLCGTSESSFGRAYTIMRRLAGSPAIELRGRRAIRAMRDAPVLTADGMIALHELDATPVAIDLERHGVPEAKLGANAMLTEIEASTTTSDERSAVDWLVQHAPAWRRVVVVHGDLHALNLWREPDGTVALLDWEVATIGPPELDAARTELMFRLVPGELPRAARPLLMWLGRRSARSFRARYVQRRHLDERTLQWCSALHALRLLTTVLTRPGDDPVAALWRPVDGALRDVVAATTGVRLP
jgi:aminoglycoside phosphotransferase (APT) family kinase protein